MIAVAPVSGTSIDELALLEFLIDRSAHFMVPRYIRVLVDLPKTPSLKVLKHQLRSEGITDDTWDREAHNISIKRETLNRDNT